MNRAFDELSNLCDKILDDKYKLYEENIVLQQENKQLKEELYEAQRQNNELEQDGQDIAKELSIRIDKAIEFIETEYNTYPSAEEWRKALKEILKSDSNEM